MSKQIETNIWSSYREPIYYQQIEWGLQNLVGKILTIIDAVIIEPRQLKATKDLIKNSFSDSFNEFQKQGSNGKAGHLIKNLLD